ncbi:MAG: hypothetical protein QOG50_3589 [Actinomycetota bacterium]|nr:hypothetical protein [Actinomycetota bacterium]
MLVPFVASRAVVLSALVLTRHVVTAMRTANPPVQASDGLLGWDASWYRDIARYGYHGVAKEGLRFFPFVPILARVGSWLPGVSVRLALLLVANASALAVGALMYELVRGEGRSEAVARRAVWIVYLAPPAFVLVMGYAEATLMTATLVALLALRRHRWWIAAIAGVIAGLTRPVGVLLVVPALVEVIGASRARGATGKSSAPKRDYIARAASVIGSLIGTGGYLVWAEHRSGDLLYPLRVQQASSRRGGWIDPARAVWRAVRDAASGDHLSAGIHVVTVMVLVALLVVLWRRWPLSFAAYASVAAVVALSARNLDSLERYSLSTVPLVAAAAELVGGGTRERVTLVALGATLVAFSVLAFTGVLVP